MKRHVILLLTFFCFNVLSAQQLNTLVTDDKGNKKLLGAINKNGLMQSPFNDWFNKNYDDYLLNGDIVNALKTELKGYTIQVFLGTWCGDSKREVPRFYAILDALNFSENQLEVIAVDNERATYKQSPSAEEKDLNIHRVPTFIFYKDGQEVNRIVESPVETLERDMLSIVQQKDYEPKYKAVTYIEGLLKTNTIENLRKDEGKIVSDVAEIIKGCYELNTYAYVKLRAQRYDEAIYLFDLNAKLFPYKDYIQYSLGNAYFSLNNYPEASKAFYKALSLNPDYKRAKDKIAEIASIDSASQ